MTEIKITDYTMYEEEEKNMTREVMTDTKEILQKVQDTLGLNQKELGVYIGVSIRTVNSWMTGERECPMHVAELAIRVAESDIARFNDGLHTSGMFRWAVIDEKENGDEFLTVCGSKADALREAQSDWDHLTPKEKEKRARFEVSLVHVCFADQPYENTHFSYYEGYGQIDGATYETAKSWL